MRQVFGISKSFSFWLITGLAMILVVASAMVKLAHDRVSTELYVSEKLNVQLASQSLRDALALPASHLRSVAFLETAVKETMRDAATADKAVISNAFETLLLRNPNYLQMRWISEDGMELVRTDRVNRISVAGVPQQGLQDKSTRPYVVAAKQLGPNELYVSPLDLNVERGEVQRPFVPVIRMAVRLFDEAAKPQGFFVLNIGAKAFLDRFTTFSKDLNLMLLNTDGFWLKTANADNEWGFMFGKEAIFPARYPEAWKNISTGRSGQLETGTGLWSWQTVSVQQRELPVPSNIELKAVAQVDRLHLVAMRDEAARPIVLAAIALALLYSVSLFLLFQEMKSRRIAEQNAIAATNTKSSFLATMSHEIRTPMTGILGFADMLLDDKLPPKTEKKVIRLKNTAHALLNIINDILDISKLDAGKLKVEALDFNPAELANDVVQLFYQTCPPEKQERLQITAKLGEDFPQWVRTDPTRLRQILINIVGNAVKFTDEGSVTVHCGHDKAERLLEFRVVDTGIGIEPETAERLFEEFEQADASISRKYHGTGLGLAICKKLVERLGGEIGVNSMAGKGSVFWFTIPYAKAASAAEDEPTVSNDSRAKKLNQLSILVAEDNEINQMIIRNILEKLNHKVQFASNGLQAFDTVRNPNNQFDLILMDVRMPEMSGTDATKAIRGLSGAIADIPIIALTADIMEDAKSTYMAAGMNGYVGKPIDPDELADAIADAMEGRASA